MDPLQNLSPPAIVGETVAGRSAYVRKQLMVLMGDIERRTFDLAELLLEAQDGSLYRTWGYEDIYDYASQELGLKERRSQYLIRIVKICRAVGVERKVYQEVGVSKLRDITRLKPEDSFWNTETKMAEPMASHIVRLIIAAKEMTSEQIEEEVRRLMGQTGENRPVMRSYSVTQSAWDNTIKPAMELARRRLGSARRDEETGNAVDYSDGVVEEMIHAEFLADANQYPEEELVDIPMEEI